MGRTLLVTGAAGCKVTRFDDQNHAREHVQENQRERVALGAGSWTGVPDW
jgi:hypothetical protein